MGARVLQFLLLLLIFALPREAAACGTCAFALSEWFFPPAIPWAILGAISYLLVGFLVPPPLDTPTGAFFNRSSILIVSVSAIIASVAFGPLPFLGLVVVTLRALWLSWKRSRTRKVAIIAVLILVPFAATGVWWTMSRLRQSKADFVLRWPGTGPARSVVLDMVAKNDLAGLRRVVSGPNGFEASQAALKLATLGKPEIDGPIMIEALRTFEGQHFEDYNVTMFNNALNALLRGKPPDGKNKAADWEEYFRNRPLPHGSM